MSADEAKSKSGSKATKAAGEEHAARRHANKLRKKKAHRRTLRRSNTTG